MDPPPFSMPLAFPTNLVNSASFNWPKHPIGDTNGSRNISFGRLTAVHRSWLVLFFTTFLGLKLLCSRAGLSDCKWQWLCLHVMLPLKPASHAGSWLHSTTSVSHPWSIHTHNSHHPFSFDVSDFLCEQKERERNEETLQKDAFLTMC